MAWILVAVGLSFVFWSRWLVHRGAPAWLGLVGFFGLIASAAGPAVTVLRLRAAFENVKAVETSQKASVLSAGIASAMGYTLGAVIALLAVALVLGWFTVFRRRSPANGSIS